MGNKSGIIWVDNEWDKLREAMVGLEDKTMAPDYMPEMSWMDSEQNVKDTYGSLDNMWVK